MAKKFSNPIMDGIVGDPSRNVEATNPVNPMLKNFGKFVDRRIPSADDSNRSVDLSEFSPYLGDRFVLTDASPKNRAINQPTGEQFGNAVLRLLPNTALEFVSMAANIIDIEDYVNSDNEVGNWLSTWAQEQKQKVNQATPIYRENPNEFLNVSDPAWWFENGTNLVQSAGAFVGLGMVTGMGTGALLGKGAKYLQWLENLTKVAPKVVRGGNAVLNAALLNQAESIGIATETFDKAFNKKLGELQADSEMMKNNTPEQIENLAKQDAAERATSALNFNKINILTNITSASLFLKTPLLTRESLLMPSLGKSAKRVMLEGTQESGEEAINLIAEKQALADDYTFADAIKTVATKEGAENMLLGFVGGAAQTGVTLSGRLLPTKRFEGQRMSENQIQRERFVAQQEQNARWDKLSKGEKMQSATDAFLTLQEQSDLIKDINTASKNKDFKKAKELSDKLLIYQASDAFNTGTTEQLLNTYQALGSMSEEEATTRGYFKGEAITDPNHYQNKAKKAVDTILKLEQAWNENKEYINHTPVYEGNGEVKWNGTYTNRAEVIDIENKLEEVNRLRSTFKASITEILDKMGVEQDAYQFNSITGELSLVDTKDDEYKTSLSELKVNELKDIAKSKGIPKYTTMNKEALINSLSELNKTSKETVKQLLQSKTYKGYESLLNTETQLKNKSIKLEGEYINLTSDETQKDILNYYKQSKKDIANRKKEQRKQESKKNIVTNKNKQKETLTSEIKNNPPTVKKPVKTDTNPDINPDEEVINPTGSFKFTAHPNPEYNDLLSKIVNNNSIAPGNRAENIKKAVQDMLALGDLDESDSYNLKQEANAALKRLREIKDWQPTNETGNESEVKVEATADELLTLIEGDLSPAMKEESPIEKAKRKANLMLDLIFQAEEIGIKDFKSLAIWMNDKFGADRFSKAFTTFQDLYNGVIGGSRPRANFSYTGIFASNKDKQDFIDNDGKSVNNSLPFGVYTVDHDNLDDIHKATITKLAQLNALDIEGQHIDYGDVNDGVYKVIFGHNKIAYLARNYIRTFEVDDNGNVKVRKQDIDDNINQISDDLLDYSKLKIGSKITLVTLTSITLDNGDVISYDGTITHKDGKIKQRNPQEVAPIGIRFNGQLLTGAFLHIADWINDENIVGDVKLDRELLIQIRRAVLNAGEEGITTDITKVSPGWLMVSKDADGKTLKDLTKNNLPDVTTFAIKKNGLIHTSYDSTTKVANNVGGEGNIMAIVDINDDVKLAIALNRLKVNQQYAKSIREAVRIFINQDISSPVVKLMEDNYGINLLSMEGLQDYIGRFIFTYNSFEGNTEAFKTYLEEQKSTVYLLRLTGNSIEFGRGKGVKFNSISKNSPKSDLNGFLDNLEKHIQGMYMNMDIARLNTENFSLPIIEGNSVKGDAMSYNDYIKSHTETKFFSTKTESGKPIYTIQKTFEFNTKGLLEEVVNEELKKEVVGEPVIKQEVKSTTRTITSPTGKKHTISANDTPPADLSPKLIESDVLNQSPNVVNYVLKSVNILTSDKAKQVFEKGKKANWTLDKILSELQIPKEQKQLILDLGITDREQLAVELASKYSYSVEVNTATEQKGRGEIPFKRLEQLNKGILPDFFSIYDDLDGTLDNKINIFNVNGRVGFWQNNEYDDKVKDLVVDEWNNVHGVKFWILREDIANKYINIFRQDLIKEIEQQKIAPTDFYKELTIDGGTNYTENEISTPLITPSIKGHAQFSTDNGIGWFRSDEQKLNSETGEAEITKLQFDSITKNQIPTYESSAIKEFVVNGIIYRYLVNSNVYTKGGYETGNQQKVRRVLEMQSDLFQKGRDKSQLVGKDNQSENAPTTQPEYYVEDMYEFDMYRVKTPEGVYFKTNGKYEFRPIGGTNTNITKEVYESKIRPANDFDSQQNQFLQLLNKDNNWVTFFIKSIIQDSAKKGYEKVLFPKGETAAKIEGHETIANEIRKIDSDINKSKQLIDTLEVKVNNLPEYIIEKGYEKYVGDVYRIKNVNTDKYEFQQYRDIKDAQYELVVLLKDKDILIGEQEKLRILNERKQELKSQGIEKLKPIEAFYEIKVGNILEKQYGKDNVKTITDEYGNEWREITIDNERDLTYIDLSPKLIEQPQFQNILNNIPSDVYIKDMGFVTQNAVIDYITADVLGKLVLDKETKTSPELFQEYIKMFQEYRDMYAEMGNEAMAELAQQVVDNGKEIISIVTNNIAKMNIVDVSLFELNEESDINDSLGTDKQRFDSEAIFKENPVSSLTNDIKKYLSAVYDVKVDNDGKAIYDENGNTIDKTGIFGLPVVVPFDVVINDLYAILANTNEQYVPPVFKTMIKELEQYAEFKPYLNNVIFLLENAPENIKSQFVTAMSKHYTHHKYIYRVYNPETKTYRLIPLDSDNFSNENKVLQDWNNRLKNSKYIQNNSNTTEELVIINKEEINERFTNIVTNFKEGKPIIIDLRNWLNDLGIKVPDTILAVLSRGMYVNGVMLSMEDMLTKSNGVFNIINKNFTTNENVVTNNPFKDKAVKVLAKKVSRSLNTLYSQSFSDVVGETYFGYSPNKYFISRYQDITHDLDLLLKLKESSFSSTSTWLNELIGKDEKGNPILKTNGIFYRNFKYFTSDGMKDQKTNKGKKLEDMSPADHELYKLSLFFNQGGQIKSLANRRIMNMLYPTISDKSLMYGMTQVGYHVNTMSDGTISNTSPIWDILYNSMVQSELNRITEFQANEAKYNIKGYDKGAKLFYLLPELNNLESIWEEGNLKSIVKNSPEYKEIMVILQKHVNSLIEQKKDTWRTYGFIDRNKEGVESVNITDSKYGKVFTNDLNSIANNFVVNYLAFNSNVIQMFSGDPALFFKADGTKVDALGNSTATAMDNVKNTFINIGKRLAAHIAPGLDIPAERGDTFTVVCLKDREGDTSLNKDYLKKILSPEDYNSYTNGDKKGGIEGTNAQEWTTLEEHLNIMLRQGRITQDKVDTLLKREEEGKPLDIRLLTGGKETLQPMKLVYMNKVWDGSIEKVVYIKTSSYPLIKQLTKGLEIDKLRVTMNNPSSKVNRVTFDTAFKAGNTKNNLDIFNSDGTIKDKLDLTPHIQVLPRLGHRRQLEVPFDEDSYKINDGTQQSKLLFTNILDLDNFTLRGVEGNLTGKQLRDKFNETYGELFKLRYNNLMNDLTVKINGVRKLDLKKVQNLLYTEGLKRNYSINDLQSISLTEKDGKVQFIAPLWAVPAASRFEALLSSIVDNRIRKRIAPGKSYVLGTEEGFQAKQIKEITTIREALDLQPDIIFDEQWLKESGGKLRPMRVENGKVMPDEVMLPMKFYNNDGKLIDIKQFVNEEGYLDTTRIDSQLLEQFGFRIPTQGHNSMTYIKVVGFIPYENGDLIIVPRDFTKRMGSDFDVDKLYTLAYNTNYDSKNGIISRVQKGQETWSEEKQLQNELLDIHFAVLGNPDKRVQKQVHTPLGFGNLETLANDIDNAYQGSNYVWSGISEDYQKNRYLSARGAKIGVGAFSLDNTFNSLLQGNDNISLFTWVEVEVNGKTKMINVPYELTLGGRTNNELSNPKTNTGNKYKSDVISAYQSASVDNEKVQLLNRLNINKHTFSTVKLLNQLGFEEDVTMYFINQPIIRDYVRLMTLAQDSSSNWNTIKANEELEKLYPSTLTEKEKDRLSSSLSLDDLRGMINDRETSYNDNQQALLYRFLETTAKGNSLGEVQSTINSDSAGVGKDLFYSLIKEDQILSLVNNSIVHNAHKLVGDYWSSDMQEDWQELSQEERDATIKQMKEDGYVLTRGGLYIKPTTINGYASVYGTLTNAKLWNKLFGYDSPILLKAVEEIAEITGNNSNIMSVKAESYRTAWNFIKSYLMSQSESLSEGSLLEERNRLLYDTDDNMSLASIINDIKDKGLLKNNPFINRLDTEIFKKVLPSKLTYNSSLEEGFDERYIYSGFIDLLSKNTVLGTYNGIEYTTKTLAQDLVTHQFITGGVQRANQFIKYIPVQYLNELGYYDMLKGINLKDRRTFGFRDGDVMATTEQYLQHYPREVANYKLEGYKLNADESVLTVENTMAFNNTVNNGLYVALPSNKTKSGYKLYKRVDSDKYIQIDTLGDKDLRETDFYSATAKTTIVSNKSAYTEPKVVEIPETFEVKQEKEFSDVKNIPPESTRGMDFEYGLRDNNEPGIKKLDNALSQILNESDSKFYKWYAQQLLNNLHKLPTNLKVVVDVTLDAEGRTEYDSNYRPTAIIINPLNIDNKEDFERVILHEITHAMTKEAIYMSGNSPAIQSLRDLHGQFKTQMGYKYTIEKMNQVMNEINSGSKLSVKIRDARMIRAAMNFDEFITESMSNKEMQETLNSFTPNKAFKNAWENFKSLVADILEAFGFEKGKLLDYVVSNVISLIDTPKPDADTFNSLTGKEIRTVEWVNKKYNLVDENGRLLPILNPEEVKKSIEDKIENVDVRIIDEFIVVEQKGTKPKDNQSINTTVIIESDFNKLKELHNTGKALYTLRVKSTQTLKGLSPEHNFGNPFSIDGKDGTIPMGNLDAAVSAYKQWLQGDKLYSKVEPERREWILKQINNGKLDNIKLGYYKDWTGTGQGLSHAHKLAEFVNEREQNKSIKGFQGYKGGFENIGKGTPQGDGKDKAMRQVADGFIGEYDNINPRPSSTYTSYREISDKTNKNGESLGRTYEDSRNGSEGYGIKTGYETKSAGNIIMLARNGKLSKTNLTINTKKAILDSHNLGAEFVVGDMPNVDSQFINYLQEIGAKFTIYHTGSKPRIQIDNSNTSLFDLSISHRASQDVKEELPVSKLLKSRRIRIATLDRLITKADANNEFAKAEEYKQQKQELIDSIDIINKYSAVEDVAVVARQDLAEVSNMLNNNLSESDILYALKITNLWQKGIDVFFDEDLLTSEKLRNEFKAIEGSAEYYSEILYKKLVNIINDFVKTNTGIDGNVDVEQVMSSIKDISKIESEVLNLSRNDNVLLSAIYNSVKKANYAAMDEAKEIVDEVNKLIETIAPLLGSKNEKYEIFRQKFSDGLYTGNLVGKFTPEFEKDVSEFNRILEGITDEGAFIRHTKKRREKVVTFDVRKLFPEYSYNYKDKYTKEEIEKYKNGLRDLLGENTFNTLMERQKRMIDRYVEDREHNRLRILSKYNMKETDSFKTNINATNEFKTWLFQNSPYEIAAEFLEYKAYKVEKKFITPLGIQRYLIEVPRKTNDDGKDLGYYDSNFDTIENNQDLLEFYNYITDVFDKLKVYLPQSVQERLQFGGLPEISKTFLELSYDVKGGKEAMSVMWNQLKESIRTEDTSDISHADIDPTTGKVDKHLSINLMKNNKQFFYDYLDRKRIEYRQANPSEKSIPVEIEERWRREAKNELAQKKSYDLGKVVKAYSMMVLAYKHKSRIEDQLKAAEVIINRSQEMELSAKKKPLKNEGKEIIFKKEEDSFVNMKASLDYFMDTFYGNPRKLEGITDKEVLTSEENQTKKDIEELLANNEALYTRGDIKEDVYKETKDTLQSQLENLGGVKVWSKVGDDVLKYIQLKVMGWNLFSGFSNVGFGWIANFIEAADGRVFNQSELLHAYKMVLHSIGKNLTFNHVKSDTATKIRSLMDKFDVLKDMSNELYNNSIPSQFTKGTKWLAPYSITQRAEYINQAPLMIALLNRMKTEDGKSLWEQFDKDGKWIGEGEIPTELLTKFRLRLDGIIEKTHGDYGSPLKVKEKILGRSLIQFRTWMFEGFAQRFETEKYDPNLDIVRKGRYRTLPTYFQKLGYIGGLADLGTNLLRKLAFQGTKFDNLTDGEIFNEVDAANMRKVLSEITIYMSLTTVAIMLKMLSAGLDDKEKYMANYLINHSSRLRTDILFYFNPIEFRKLLRDPIPAATLIKDVTEWVYASGNYVGGNDIYKTGVYAGESRLFRESMQLLPFGTQIYRNIAATKTQY